jgi:transcriptional regulator with XRE-family HTH domain
MTSVAAAPTVGTLLRDWRQRRRMSQMDLSLEAEVSTRHLSFVETGRSKPSRELVLHLAEHLDVPLRERNSLLLAAGYAPSYVESPLDAGAMAPVRAALDAILAGHEPFPAVVVDRRWDLVTANRPALGLLAGGVAPELLAPPTNTLRLVLHPEGLAPRVANLGEYSAHLLDRLRRQAAASGDPELLTLHEELAGYPGVRDDGPVHASTADLLFVPLVLRAEDATLTFFSTIATFGTALDITIAELAVESFFPADEATSAALRAFATATATATEPVEVGAG